MTRRTIVQAALAAPAVLGTAVEPISGNVLDKANSLLFSIAPDSRTVFEDLSVGMLHAEFKERPFPVPRWLAEHKLWKRLVGIDRRKAEGIWCERHETGLFSSHCDTCGSYRMARDPVHFAVATIDGKEQTTAHCPDCCPACKKRGLVS